MCSERAPLLFGPTWALVVLTGLLGAAAALAQTTEAPLAVRESAPGVFVHFGAVEDWLPENGGDVANLGFVVGTRCVAVIDTGGTPQLGRRLRAAVARATAVPICYVINTHAHPDHVLGNSGIAPTAGEPAVQFVASKKFNTAMSAREPFYTGALKRDFGIALAHEAVVYPTVIVERTLQLDLGGRELVLTAWPTAHTDNDLTVFDTQTRSLFTADLLFVQHMPVIDGNLRGWLAVMGELAKVEAALVIPGHGAASADWPAALAHQREYLEAVLRETRAAIKARVTLPRAVESVARDAAASWSLADRFHRRNVTAAYAELEWED
jgi:quinoprotein relay system zinc metallohydrolase 2